MRELNPKRVFELIQLEKVTHLGGAPTVLSMLCNLPKQDQLPLPHTVQILTAGAPPTSAIVKATEALGFNLLQMYGLTETFGQVLVSEHKDEYATENADEQAALEQEIIESTKAHLAKFKVPKRVIFGNLPRNGAGKIQKFMLRDVAKEDAQTNQPTSKL